MNRTLPDIATARSFLFVPGNRPDRFESALSSAADVVIVDLEDAVAPDSKDAAREHLAQLLDESGPHVAVRVNPAGTAWHDADLDLARRHDVPVVLPKATAGTVGPVAVSQVLALVESAQGLLDAADIARNPMVRRLALGHLDLAAELGVSPEQRTVVDHARTQLLVASVAAELDGPVDGVTAQVKDADRLTADIADAIALGCTGKLCIHPNQVGPLHDALTPGADEVARARRVLDAPIEDGVTVVDGQMVDAPVLAHARRVLSRAHEPTPAREGETP